MKEDQKTKKKTCDKCHGMGMASKPIYGGLSSILAECDQCSGTGKVKAG